MTWIQANWYYVLGALVILYGAIRGLGMAIWHVSRFFKGMDDKLDTLSGLPRKVEALEIQVAKVEAVCKSRIQAGFACVQDEA